MCMSNTLTLAMRVPYIYGRERDVLSAGPVYLRFWQKSSLRKFTLQIQAYKCNVWSNCNLFMLLEG